MAKKSYNLNNRKGTKMVLLILALGFVAAPLIMLIVQIINMNAWM